MITNPYAAVAEPVQLYEQVITLPTYALQDAEPFPIFYTGRVCQGAKGPVYPYPLQNRISDTPEERSYRAVYLENEYVKFSVLPELGGRLFTGLDKTNGYDFIYRQNVIKPALIGMLGAWISGGIEWNVPHHHRASTFMPVDIREESNPDGSKTVWVGEVEPRHRMRWLVGLTLHPGRSYIEMTGRMVNRTPLAHSFLFWANTAVHTNDDYQVIFPPSTEFATHHNKNQFTEWPISHQVYGGHDFTRGVDVSWWRNIPRPQSFFAWNYEDDFFGGYDHGRDVGIVSIADHHVAPGKKAWVWGKNDQAAVWDKVLTDNDGPYIELMTGAYSDNQPDYSWCQPYETKSTSFYWYPIRGIRGLKEANLEAAANLEVLSEGHVQFGFCTTAAHRAAKILVQVSDAPVYESACDIAPDNPFWHELSLGRDVRPEDVRISLCTETGEELVAYQPAAKRNAPMPDTAKPPRKPDEIPSVEELFLTGLWVEQFHNAVIDPYLYYEEALKRDPGDYRTNTQLGSLYIKRAMFGEAETCLRKAVERVSMNYSTPKDAEATYYLGLALRYQGRLDEAYDAFGSAARSYAWRSASLLNMSEIAGLRGDLATALRHVNESVASNSASVKALELKMTLLRHLGRKDEALATAESLRILEPLDFRLANELRILHGAQEWQEQMKDLLRGDVRNYLELANDYATSGFLAEATDVLRLIAQSSQYPMVYYDLAYYAEQSGAQDEAEKYYAQAGSMPLDYCFPYMLESVAVLQSALKHRPDDATPHYLLGNLLYDWQPESAIRLWQRAVALDDTLALAHRNLAFALPRDNQDLHEAIAHMKKALEFGPPSARGYYEYDILLERIHTAPEERFELLSSHHDVVATWDEALGREIVLMVLLGKYDQALEALATQRFLMWEGGTSMHSVYMDAHLLRGRSLLKGKEPEKALEDFRAALEYPDNLGFGRPPGGGREATVYYYLGLAHEAAGDSQKAEEAFQACVTYEQEMSERAYYQAMAHRKLGNEDKAKALLAALADYADSGRKSAQDVDAFAKFGEKERSEKQHAQYAYLMGLSRLGRGEKEEAREAFSEALRLDPCHLGARIESQALVP